MFAKSAALIGMASMASAHIIMTNPVPYGSPNSSPLAADGSDFPCKGASPGGEGNKFEAGSKQQLSFMGSAVHGGGSCQISVTTDKNPTKESSWKVIKSIEGGCPAKNEPLNRPENPNDTDGDVYDFEIPSKMADGEYVFAWTWFNKVGNREMYMNCASVSVTGGSNDKSFLDSLPDMYVANIGNGCATTEGKDMQFNNKGDTDKFNGATSVFLAVDPKCTVGSGNPGEPEQPEDPQDPEDPQPTPPPQNPEPTQPPQNPEPTPEPTPSSSVPGGVFPPAPTGGNPPPEGGEGAKTPGSPCENEGEWNCVGGSSFQRCGSGAWTEVMPLSSGMTCNPGSGPELQAHAIRGANSMRRRALKV